MIQSAENSGGTLKHIVQQLLLYSPLYLSVPLTHFGNNLHHLLKILILMFHNDYCCQCTCSFYSSHCLPTGAPLMFGCDQALWSAYPHCATSYSLDHLEELVQHNTKDMRGLLVLVVRFLALCFRSSSCSRFLYVRINLV